MAAGDAGVARVGPIAAGPEAEDAPIGQTMLVHPWIGCSDCDACNEGRENDCTRMTASGVARDGGYAPHVLVDHQKALVDVEGVGVDTVPPSSFPAGPVANELK